MFSLHSACHYFVAQVIRTVLIIFLVEERKDVKTVDIACLHKFMILAKIIVLILCSLAPF